jgi:ABC-type multidrug transport system fused ATPase/permease subunit
MRKLMGKPENLFRGKMFVSFNRKKQNKNERKEKKEEEESQINRRENSSSCRFQAGRTYIVVLRRSNSSPIMFWLSSFSFFAFFLSSQNHSSFCLLRRPFSLSLSLVGFSFNLFCYFPGRINHI